ncbi:MAG: hypothetical protein M3014_12885 [Chloroflexota bacterium]|nr:hypothetical protein [Chloroflexota bacterium]
MGDCPPLCLALTIAGLVIASGGVYMVFRGSHSINSSTARPYVPFATIVVGLLISYRTYTGFSTLDGQDILIMAVFVFGLFSMLGLQFFVVDKSRQRASKAAANNQEEKNSLDER